jgi:hypothetical protein
VESTQSAVAKWNPAREVLANKTVRYRKIFIAQDCAVKRCHAIGTTCGKAGSALLIAGACWLFSRQMWAVFLRKRRQDGLVHVAQTNAPTAATDGAF